MVLSTSLHEFQGLAVLEAVQLGCIPILPNRLVYPELFNSTYLYKSSINSPSLEASSAADLIQHHVTLIDKGISVVPVIKNFEWPAMAAAYKKLGVVCTQR
jgi:hypothetical protein